MKFVAAALALATAVSAGNYGYPSYNTTSTSSVYVTYSTKVYTDKYETACPYATTYIQKGSTYSATPYETYTYTDCPCTVSVPIYTTSAVYSVPCNTSSTAAVPTTPYSTGAVYPTTTSPPVHAGAGKASLPVAGLVAAGLAALL